MSKLLLASQAWMLHLLISHCQASLIKPTTTSPKPISSSSNKTQGVDVDLLFSTPEGRRGLDDIQIAPLIAACVAVFFGAVLCFAGARVLRYAALGCAFFDGAFTTAAVLERVLRHAEWEGVASWTFFFLGGIFCCLLVVSIDRLDVFCLGLTAGMMAAFTCLTTFGYHIAPDHPEVVLYGLLGVLGLGTGLLTLKTQPVSVLPATSWIGSNMATWGIGYFFGEYPNGTSIKKFRRQDGKYELPRAWWGYLAGALICFLMGVCVQAQTYRFKRKRHAATRHFSATSDAMVSPHCDDDFLDEPRNPRRYVRVQTPPASESRRPTHPLSSSRPLGRTAIV